MYRSILAGLLNVGAGIGLAGCTDTLLICVDTGSDPAIIVQVRDAVTGAPLAAGARGAIQDGTYIDSLRPRALDPSGRLLYLAAGAGRPGRYDVTVLHPGYLPWQRSEVIVGINDCGLAGRFLHADLEPAP